MPELWWLSFAMGSGLWSLDYGGWAEVMMLWCLGDGTWALLLALWCLDYGASVVFELWAMGLSYGRRLQCLDYGGWCLGCGAQAMAPGL